MNYTREIDHDTSVKSISVIKEPTNRDFGVADFRCRLVFSVFDYGTISPPIPLDNSTINLMMGFNFELLREYGIDSHYMSLVTDEGEEISAREAISRRIAPTTARVQFANRLMPEFNNGKWDYSMFGQSDLTCYVQPIEFISRNVLPEASSVWKRVEKGEMTLENLGLPVDFKRGDEIPENLRPILDYSTKFEPDDRYISQREAQTLMNISDEDFAKINNSTRRASNVLTHYASSRGFKREDGKVEYVGFILGDAVCTWHEDRLTVHGIGISKQRIRDEVKKLNQGWYDDIEKSKEKAKKEGVKDFRTLMDSSIKYVSPSIKFFESINNLFRAGTNQWVDKKVYNIYPRSRESTEIDLEKAVQEFQKVA